MTKKNPTALIMLTKYGAYLVQFKVGDVEEHTAALSFSRAKRAAQDLARDNDVELSEWRQTTNLEWVADGD